MSYYSDFKYGKGRDQWFEAINFYRWFKGCKGPILDIGCAAGDLISLNPEIIEGIDFDEDSLRIAESRGYRVKKIDIDTSMHLLESEKYEGIWAMHVIEHLYNPLNFLKEVRRLLILGGKAVIYTPNCPYLLYRINKNFWNDYTHKRPFTKFTLERIAYDAGFRKIKIYEDFRCFPGAGRIMKLFRIPLAVIAKIQRIFFIKGLSLILVIEK